MNANFAYRSLTYQGFTKETIYYLSSDTNLDLDNNNEADDVDGDATNDNLKKAITEWAAKDADSLVLYIVDHGGEKTYRMSGIEILSAYDLDSWLDTLQNTMKGKIIIIYDACKSGSFLPILSDPQRIIITSTSPNEDANFISQGSISFSNHFWTHVFNGYSVRNAFNLASEAIAKGTDFKQTPLLDGNGNGNGNEAPDDYDSVQDIFIGNGTVIQGDAPNISEVSDKIVINGTNSASLYAKVTDDDGDDIVRVWAVIRSPDYKQGASGKPVFEMPSVDLKHIDGNLYEATYDEFNTEGTYQIAIYARDNKLNTSVPKIITVSVENPLRRRAIIVAGGSLSDKLWTAVKKNIELVYNALNSQGYSDDDIYLMSPASIPGVTKISLLPSLLSLNYAITGWAEQNTQDIVLYLIGNGGKETFQM